MTTLSRLSELQAASQRMLGFPLNLAPPRELLETLHALRDQPMNNLGSPWCEGALKLDSKADERWVVEWFANLWGLPPSEATGHVTGWGSLANVSAIATGAIRYPKGVLYVSDAVHYSAEQAALITTLPLVMVKTDQQGRFDLDDFALKLDRTRPAILCLTAGTTMSGAVDPIRDVCALLPSQSYVHVDAALFGLVLPFFDEVLSWDFRVPRVDSICVSGHKLLGVPEHCSVLVQRKTKEAEPIEYIGARDVLLGGSRSGHAPALLRAFIEHYADYRLGLLAHQCVGRANWLRERIPGAWINPVSPIVVLPKPADWVCAKYQLAVQGDTAHVITMPHVGYEILREFLADLQSAASLCDAASTHCHRGFP